MKPLVLLGCCCLLGTGAFAQHHGSGVGGVHSGGARAGHQPASGHGSIRTSRKGGHHYGYGGYYGGYYPWFYDDGYDLPAEAGPPNVTMLYPAPPPAAIVTQAAHPMIHEYTQQDVIQPERDTHRSFYTIALRDKTVETAMTYWVDNGTLYYLDADRQEKRAPLSSVDRDLSVRLNREHQMPFDIP